jgi:hypothetical protein
MAIMRPPRRRAAEEFRQNDGGRDQGAVRQQQGVPAPLVSLGTMAIGQCGVSSDVANPIEAPYEDDYAIANSGVDICEVHDYDAESVSDPSYEWYGLPYNSLSQRIDDCGGKPMVVGEAGIEANVHAGNVDRVDCGISKETPGYDPATGWSGPVAGLLHSLRERSRRSDTE